MFVVAVVIYDLKHVVSKHNEPGPSMSDQGVSMDLAEFGQYVPREHDSDGIVRRYYKYEGRCPAANDCMCKAWPNLK